jgi:penicillin amidase
MQRFLLKAFLIVAVLVAMTLAAAYLYARGSLPVLNGTIVVEGLSGPVDIIRDADAIPHIFASTRLDSLYGLGYVHAQDRLWQMEFQRRIGFGRLSEIFGPTTLPQDRVLRTIGFGRAARTAWARMPPSRKIEIDAYVAGVNAFLAAHRRSALPPEFTLLRFEPDPWDGADVVVWQKMMAWDLSANYSFELLRHDLAGKVGAAGMADLMPAYPKNGLSILGWHPAGRAAGRGHVPQGSQVARGSRPAMPTAGLTAGGRRTGPGEFDALISGLSRGLPAVRDLLVGGAATEALGSNNWVVDGTLTASGKPLLANDPHLSARLPSTWYLAHVSGGEYDAIGASIPGTPAIVLGRNRSIAWAATNVAADVEDLFREKLDVTGRFAEFRGRMEALQLVPEMIRINGRTPVLLDVRISRHGPLVSDAINANNAEIRKDGSVPTLEPLSFRWTALDLEDTTVIATMRLSEARNWEEFTTALRDFVVPAQNFLYADVAGHIGYYAPGRIPIRASGDGAMPSEGWTGESEWSGWVPFDQLPHVYDPPDHLIVTANQRPMPAAYPYLLGLEWPEPYRAQRIVDLLRGRTRLRADDFAAIQADTLSLHARALLPVLIEHARPEDAADVQAVRTLTQWGQDARGDSGAAAIFEAWFLRLAPTLVTDKLGIPTTENYEGRFSYVTRFVLNALSGTSAGQWCDDTRTTEIETCDAAVTKALHQAVIDLTRRLGGDMGRWRWDAVHRATFPHQGLDGVTVLGPLVSRSVPSGGDWSTVDVGTVATDHLYEQRSVAGYRQIIDLSPANDSRYLDALGESGHPLSRHYDDFLADWRAVRHRRMRIERADIEQGATGRLRLIPGRLAGATS